MGSVAGSWQEKMETHPPKLVEEIVGAFIPPACREHGLGDWYELYKSPSQYLFDAGATLPFVVASQIRRTFSIQLFLSELCGLYIAFACGSFWRGPGYLYDARLLLPLALIIGAVLFILTIRDAYDDPLDESAGKKYFDAGLALTLANFAQRAIGVLTARPMLPVWLIIIGTALSVPMLVIVRKSYRKTTNHPPTFFD